MKVKSLLIFLTICCLFLTTHALYAQTFTFPTTSYSDVPQCLGTRAMGMAGAFTGIADDASTFYWNPAGLGFQERNGISSGFAVIGSTYWHSYLNYNLPRSSINIIRSDISGTLSWLGNNGKGLRDIFIFSHAIPFGDLFSIGFNLKGISADSGDTTGYGCDLGTLLKTKYFCLGFTIYDLLTQIGSTKSYQRYRIGFGIGPFSTVMIGSQIEALVIEIPDVGYVPLPQFRTGVEGWLIDGHLGIRGGYYIIPYSIFSQAKVITFSNEQVGSVGASLKFKNFSLDYAYMVSVERLTISIPGSPSTPLPPLHNHWVSVSFMWGKTKAEIAKEEKEKLEAMERDRKAREMLLIESFSETIAQKNAELEALRSMRGTRDETIEGMKAELEKVKSDSITLAHELEMAKLELEKIRADSQVLNTQLAAQLEQVKGELAAARIQLDKFKIETMSEKEKAEMLKERLERMRAIGVVDPLLKEAITKGVAKEVIIREVPEGLLLRFSRDFFFSGQNLESVAYRSLDVIIKAIKDYPGHTVTINGYTDITGSKSRNLKISLACAKAVASYFIAKGIPKDKVFTNGYGPDSPIAPNSTKAGRKQNRRVEIIINK